MRVWRVLALAIGLAACGQTATTVKPGAACGQDGLSPADTIREGSAAIDQGALDDQARANALANRGFAQSAKDDPSAALRDFVAALALNPENIHAKLGRAQILADSGQLDAAQPLIDSVIASGQFKAEAYAVRGNINARRGDDAAAISDFDTALQANPRMASVLAYRGQLKQDRHDLPGARADFDAAITIDAHNAKALAGRCWNRVEVMGEATSDVDAARSDGEAAIAANSSLLDGQLCLGLVLMKQEQWSRARAVYNDAVTLSPANAAALYGRGVAAKKDGDSHGGADIDHAYQINSRIDAEFERLGVRR